MPVIATPACRLTLSALALLAASVVMACEEPEAGRCGPRTGVVTRIVDGDTVELASGEKVRFLMVDTPETTSGATDCYGQEAKAYTTSLLLDQTVTLEYDVECEDRYGRLLAYVSVSGREINTLLVERGYACVLHIPPNGEDRVSEFETLEYQARSLGIGVWGACAEVTCAN